MLYQYIDPIGDGNDVFSKLIGYDGSLKEAVSISRAAILYPEGKPNILLTAAKGCGVSYFAQMVFRFAIKAGVVKASASILIARLTKKMMNIEDLFSLEQKKTKVCLANPEMECFLLRTLNCCPDTRENKS